MPAKKTRNAPKPSLRRMPRYLRCLQRMAKERPEWVSCTHIAEQLDLDPTLVRKDLAMTGITGRPKTGYLLAELVEAIEHFVGWDTPEDAFLIGAGNMGAALLGFGGFQRHGLNIVTGFDIDPGKVGTKIHGKEILHIDQFVDMARRMHVEIGIIACGVASAQQVADTMVEGGIRAIWNFAPIKLQIPENVIIEYEDLSATLAVLSRKLASRRQLDAEAPVCGNDP